MDRVPTRISLSSMAMLIGVITVCVVQGCGGGQAQTDTVEQLAASEGSGNLPELQSLLDSELLRLGVDTSRSGSIAPTAGNAVFDLQASVTTITPGEKADVQLRWTERLIGDYDQNGIVNASDITPLAQHFGETINYRSAVDTEGIEGWPVGLSYAPNDASNWRLARIDGNMDGVINAADVTPIAQHWQQSLSGYRVYRRLEGETDATMLQDAGDAEALLSIRREALLPADGNPDNTKPLSYSFSDTLTDAGQYLYYVAAYDALSDGEGPGGKPVHPKLNALPIADLSADPLAGEAPLTVNFDARASNDPDGEIVNYEFDLDGDGSFEQSGSDPDASSTYNGGTYTIGLLVTDDNGASATASVEISVNDRIVPVITANKTTAQLPVDFLLSASSSVIGSPLASCSWFINDSPVPEQSSPELQSFSPQFSATGFYRVRLLLTGEDGLTRSASVSLQVVSESPIIPIIKPDRTISELPASFLLSAGDSVLGSPLSSCEWFINAQTVAAQSSTTLDSFNFQPQFTGFYQVKLVLTSTAGFEYSTSLSLQVVNETPIVPIITADKQISPLPAQFSLSSQASMLESPLATVEWFVNDAMQPAQSASELDVFIFQPHFTGFYVIRLVLTSTAGYKYSSSISLQVYSSEDNVPVIKANIIEDSLPSGIVLSADDSIIVTDIQTCEWTISGQPGANQSTPELQDFLPVFSSAGLKTVNLRLVDINGFDWLTSINLYVWPAPQAVIEGGDNGFWHKSTAEFSGSDSIGNQLSFEWDLDARWLFDSDYNVFETDFSSPEISFECTLIEVFTIRLRVTDRFGKQNVSNRDIPILRQPYIAFGLDEPYEEQGDLLYEGQSVDMLMRIDGPPEFIGDWKIEFPGTGMQTLTGSPDVWSGDSAYVVVPIYWNEGGTIDVQISVEQTLSEVPPPGLEEEILVVVATFKPEFTADSFFPPAGNEITFDNSASISDLPVAGYSWDFETDGISDQAGLAPVVSNSFVPGQYTVTMYMIAENGYVRSASHRVGVLGGEIVVIRNDGHLYDANYDAITSDIDELGYPWSVVDYYPGIADVESGSDDLIYIWYRGGPGTALEPAPYTTQWTSGEIDDYLAFMNYGKRLLMMSQSHGKAPDITISPSLWETGLGMTLLANSIDPSELRYCWAIGMPTDHGYGYGGALGWFSSTPQNVSISGQHLCRFMEDGVKSPDRYLGPSGSGELPIELRINNCYQLCGIGEYGQSWGFGGAPGPNLQIGISTEPVLGYRLSHLSYGNKHAPDNNIGFYPYYHHESGPGRLWIIGYPWAQAEISSSASGSMTRADLLHNTLGWLVETLP